MTAPKPNVYFWDVARPCPDPYCQGCPEGKDNIAYIVAAATSREEFTETFNRYVSDLGPPSRIEESSQSWADQGFDPDNRPDRDVMIELLAEADVNGSMHREDNPHLDNVEILELVMSRYDDLTDGELALMVRRG